MVLVHYVWNKSGKQLAIVEGYTFYRSVKGAKKNIWRCTRWGACRARLIMTVTGTVLDAHLDHPHNPPLFIIRDGVYYKI